MGAQADLFVGYNLPVGSQFLLGVQGEGTPWSTYTQDSDGRRDSKRTNKYMYTSTVNDNNSSTDSSTYSQSANFSDDLVAMVALVGRAGVFATPNVLIYGIGGVAAGDFTYSSSSPSDQNARVLNDRQVWANGYTVGGGGEWKVSRAMSIRTEYRFYHFDYDRSQASFSSSKSGSNGYSYTYEDNFSRNWTNDVDLHTGKIGVVYQFCGLMGGC